MNCPKCNAGDKDLIGYEIPGVYDGVAYWGCACGHHWHRFKPNDSRRVRLEALRFMMKLPEMAERPEEPESRARHVRVG